MLAISYELHHRWCCPSLLRILRVILGDNFLWLPYSIDDLHETLLNCAGLLIYTTVLIISTKKLKRSNDLFRGSLLPFGGVTCRQSCTNDVRTQKSKQWVPEKGLSLKNPSDWTILRIGELMVSQNSGENSLTLLDGSVIIDFSPWSINWDFSSLNLPLLGVVFTTSSPSKQRYYALHQSSKRIQNAFQCDEQLVSFKVNNFKMPSLGSVATSRTPIKVLFWRINRIESTPFRQWSKASPTQSTQAYEFSQLAASTQFSHH